MFIREQFITIDNSMTSSPDAQWPTEQQESFWYFVLDKQDSFFDLPVIKLVLFLDKERFTTSHQEVAVKV